MCACEIAAGGIADQFRPMPPMPTALSASRVVLVECSSDPLRMLPTLLFSASCDTSAPLGIGFGIADGDSGADGDINYDISSISDSSSAVHTKPDTFKSPGLENAETPAGKAVGIGDLGPSPTTCRLPEAPPTATSKIHTL